MKSPIAEIVIIMYYVMQDVGLMLMRYMEIYWPRTRSLHIGEKNDF